MDQSGGFGRLSRRDFLAAGTAGLGIAGTSPLAYAAQQAPLPDTFTMFPENYTWSAAVRLAVGTCMYGGGDMGEIFKVCTALKGNTADNAAWFDAWKDMGERVARLGDQASGAGHRASAAAAYMRAANYIHIGERLRQPRTAETESAYVRAVDLFKRGLPAVSSVSVQAVEIPFEGGKNLPGYFVKGAGTLKWPTVVFFDGLDLTKEIQYFMGVSELVKRGMACLIVDSPGNGESIRFRGMPARHDFEVPGGAAIDYLQGRDDVDRERIGILGISLGGYWAPRAAAFEKRFKACVAWGALYDYHEIWKRRIAAAFKTALSVPGEHLTWFLGVDTMDAALRKLEPWTLAGVMSRIECPFLLTHGEADAQISVDDARRQFAEAGSRDKTLKIFTREEGGAQHCQLDNLTLGVTYIADWFADKLTKA